MNNGLKYSSAFPFGGGSAGPFPGLSKREWFAGMALISMSTNLDMSAERIAEMCYALADSMLEEGSKEE